MSEVKNKTMILPQLGKPLTPEEIRNMEEPTPVWWENAGYWCTAHKGTILLPSGLMIHDVEDFPDWLFYPQALIKLKEEDYKPCKVCENYHHFIYKGFKDEEEMIKYINGESNLHVGGGCKFCPKCGRPLTKEAWDELVKRLRGW